VITTVLRKIKKNNYTEPKLFKPITLLYTLGKALEKVITIYINYLIKEYGLFLVIYIKRRKLTFLKNAIYILIKIISVA